MLYKDYQTNGEKVYQKLQNGKKLTKEDLETIKIVLNDPLQEFCRREAPFRLTEFHNVSKETEVDEILLENVTETIRDSIDGCEKLYDDMDSDIEKNLEED